MTKIDRALLLHGYAETPERTWFPWLHAELEKEGIAVIAPALPKPLQPNYKKWMKTVLPFARTMTKSTVIIAHSIGGVLALRMLEKRLSKRIAGVILVSSPFAATIRVKAMLDFFDRPIDWWTVRKAASKFEIIHAKDDPLVPFDHALRYQEALDGELTLMKKGSHYTAKSVPLIINALRKI